MTPALGKEGQRARREQLSKRNTDNNDGDYHARLY